MKRYLVINQETDYHDQGYSEISWVTDTNLSSEEEDRVLSYIEENPEVFDFKNNYLLVVEGEISEILKNQNEQI